MPGFFDVIFGSTPAEPSKPKLKKVKKVKNNNSEIDVLQKEINSLKNMLPLFTRKVNEKPESESKPEIETDDSDA